MNKVIFLVLRRMRAPLVMLIIAYAVSILGMVLIPGVDNHGRPWRMDFLHAFYFVSYMASTIGFGEIPYPFTEAQRLWTVASIYLTVITWIYAIGKILSLVQDLPFRAAVTEQGFARSVRGIREPFYIVCGYGDTGSLLVRSLAQRHILSVAIDWNQDRINELIQENLSIHVPGLCADAGLSRHLKEAGLLNPYCIGVVALTDSDQTNLQIAVASKLLNPGLTVICRAETREAENNMLSFGTDHVVNPFKSFAERFALALHSPAAHLLHEWLTAVPATPLASPLYPPHGKWILCSYGRFGKALREQLEKQGLPTVIVENDPHATGCADLCVVGRGTEAYTLEEAGVREAVGIVAGTDSDADNLSIVMTARDLNPDLFTVGRQNRRDNRDIFEAARLDRVMQRSEIIARKVFSLLTTPELSAFLLLIRAQDKDWANEMVSRLTGVVGEVVPEVWLVNLSEVDAPAVVDCLAAGGTVGVADLLRDPRNREHSLNCLPLLLLRGGETLLAPDGAAALQAGDRILCCGRHRAAERMKWTLGNDNALHYILTGEERPDGWVWRWWARRRTAG